MDDNVLFVRSSSGAEDLDNPWDDTELIRAYEKAFKVAKEAVDEKPNKTQEKKKWKKGQFCRSTFAEDGVEYEARIAKLLDGDNCIVKYIGYGNEEKTPLSTLKNSGGAKARHKQLMEANDEIEMDWDECSSNRSSQRTASNQRSHRHTVPPLHLSGPPLPPPPVGIRPPETAPDSNEALNAMLMSWYMSGYHTGYYEGLKQAGK